MKELLFVVGNRPQYVKLGILLKKIKKFNIKYKILDTGQHYDIKNYQTYSLKILILSQIII